MKRVVQLDGVRGVAILFVLVWHYLASRIVAEPGSLADSLKTALSLTWSGVDLFFVLSGFLIMGILLDHQDSPNYFRVFYFRRACRIFPVYFLLLLVYACLATPVNSDPGTEWLLANPHPLWSYATFTQNICMGLRGDFGPHWLGITWSLAIEEQFYLVMPLLVLVLKRRNLAGVLIVLILAAPILRQISFGFYAYVNTPWRSDSLLSGALLALLVRSVPVLAWVRNRTRLLAAVFLALLMGAAILTLQPEAFGVWNHFWLAGLYSVFILMTYASDGSRLTAVLRTRWFVWFGRRSYGIYMFHEAISGLLFARFRKVVPVVQTTEDLAVTIAALVLTFALAELSFQLIESPFLSLGQRYKYGAKADASVCLATGTA
jgi:peptidoglycan/LPS O-acetylase OafA/YrhL